MNQKTVSKILRIAIVVLLNVFIVVLAGYAVNNALQADNQSVQTLSKNGSRGEEVRKIQERLKAWGYYNGNVDGIFGPQTEEAVRYFQSKNGLQVDGIAGPATLAAIGISSSGSGGAGSGVAGTSDSDYRLLARLISAEARGEPYIGQVAVGAVILNRVEHPSFPNSIAGVAYEPGAFTAMTDGQINQPVAESAYKAAQDALNGWDPSGGAIYYYNPDKTSNKWIRTRPVIKRIGAHLFCS